MSSTDTDLGTRIEDEGRRYAERRDYDRDDPAAIERNIDATRADVQATLAALERRLSFDRLVELTIGRIRERGGEFAGNLTDTATQNPMPVLLTSIGLGWMMLTSRRGSGNGAPRAHDRAAEAANRMSAAADSVGGRFHEAGARLHDAVESSRESLGETAESVRDTARRAASATREHWEHAREQMGHAREQADYARQRMNTLLHEQPLLLGALGLAAGAIIGALLPTSEAEDRILGEARDQAVKNVARTSRTLYEAARENAAAFAPHGREDEGERPSRPH
jgi:hypothetical protein